VKTTCNNRTSGFVVDLAIGYYNEHPTMVEESIFKSWFSDCGPYLRLSHALLSYASLKASGS